MRDQFSTALKEAMKAGDKRRIATVRLITAALKDRDIEARGAGKEAISDEEIMALLQKMVRQRQESVTIYEGAGRTDLAEQEKEEIAVINTFLPKAMDADEAREAIKAVIAELGASSLRDMGKVVGALKERFPGRLDFGKVSPLVKELLGA
ncbi:MAG: GatB/YqeY domain-containing protein [Labrys sp. (in: a-proteobacteria)]